MAVQVESSVTDIDAMKGEFPRIGWLLRLLSDASVATSQNSVTVLPFRKHMLTALH